MQQNQSSYGHCLLLKLLLSFQGYLAFALKISLKIISSNRTSVGALIYLRSIPRGTKALARTQTPWFHRVWGIFQMCYLLHLAVSTARALVPRVISVCSLKKKPTELCVSQNTQTRAKASKAGLLVSVWKLGSKQK